MATANSQDPLPARKPLDSQRNIGSDMSMMAIVQTGCPSRFAYPDEHRIKGLNAETIARIHLPTPPWLMNPEYAVLQSDPGQPNTNIFMSLNISLYNQHVVPSDWTDEWFFMTGRAHPYALTWELLQNDGLETDVDTVSEYTIAAFIVRDLGYQPIIPRNLSSMDSFPAVPPTVSFTGPVIGSGRNTLQNEVAATLGDVQLRCCAFIQLSTFITPGNSSKSPFRGFYPFQVFVIFPIQVNPWSALCKKMIEKPESQFHPGSPFSCTGKIAGLLDHTIMKQPPELQRDYVFIVVPDTWTFPDKNAAASASTTLPPTTPTKIDHSISSSLLQAAEEFTTTRNRTKRSVKALPTPDGSPSTARVSSIGLKRRHQPPYGEQRGGSSPKQLKIFHVDIDGPTPDAESSSTARNNSPNSLDSACRNSDSLPEPNSTNSSTSPINCTTAIPSEATSRLLRHRPLATKP
ncbi:hypothetical protein VFPPC_12426 [Pochonia chlamydosporia 170]|uniref:Uncharacterized protein n=1 Tax=Pochonia chlamydosporia 170 TaxID=1380566 RepID=A0A179EXG5_METCM|nr:hypothetical protein VFPPC_12426 [Pochonia chlamydosporia 170]OAQ57861.1 hypothetical protein VFPPC_12426 [Pochonia chlamydosporia 170]